MTFPLDEAATRAKVIELLDMCNSKRMDMWLISGTIAGVLDAAVVEKCMIEELPRRSHLVRHYWLGDCNCRGRLN